MVWEPTSCCGISRRTAGFIIASITAIYCAIDIGFTIYVLSNGFMNQLMKQHCNRIEQTGYYENEEDCFATAPKFFSILVTLITARMLMETLHVIFSFLLIHGIRKNIPRLMVPYMVVMLIAIALLTLFAAIMVVVLMVVNVRAALIAAVILGGIIFTMTYFTLVVRAHYKAVDGPTKDDYRRMKA